MENAQRDNVQLAFSFSDEDFMAFLPESEEEQFYTRWSDFNFHDPGVTAYEAMQLSFEDFFYRYDFPIQDLMQGIKRSAFDDWGVRYLHTLYAVTEDDYRRVLATDKYIKNVAVVPVLKANLNPNTEDLICLLDVNVATDIPIMHSGIVNEWENDLIKNRAVGEYFNRQKGQETFIRNKIKKVQIQTKVSLYPIGEDKLYFRKIFKALENYLLPNLESADFRNVDRRGRDLSEIFTGPAANENDQQNVINDELFQKPAYRRFILVSELFEVMESLSYVRNVSYVEIKTENGRYENAVLDLGDYTFTELFKLDINGHSLDQIMPLIPLYSPNPKSKTPDFTYELEVEGQYRDLGNSPSLQTSFPPNYEMGRYVANQNDADLDKTASFRGYLYLMDQVRANISGQMGYFYNIFSITPKLPSYVEADISDKPEYKDIYIPDLAEEFSFNPNNPNQNLSIYSYLAGSEEIQHRFQEERLNYLLALNGWGVGANAWTFWSRTQYTKIKNDFLNLVHRYSGKRNPCEAKDLNCCFQSNSLVLLQEKIRVLLQFDVDAVRVLEHFLLQPVWEGERGLNFELTVFLFEKNEPKHITGENREYKNYIERVIRAMIPAHIVETIKWIPFNGKNPSKNLEMYDNALRGAFPSGETYYLNSEITPNQRRAMEWLKNDWIKR